MSEILCTGRVRAVVTDGLYPVAYSDMGEAIPGHSRWFAAWRDQNQCPIEGCHSRYRLQPHHIRQRAHGGNHDPDNLVTLRWYHHHVAIHGLGYRIDPNPPFTADNSSNPKTTDHRKVFVRPLPSQPAGTTSTLN